MKKINITLMILSLFVTSMSYAQHRTPDYWKCESRTGGSWLFGKAPQACSAQTFISENLVYNKFSPYIFDDSKSSSSERVRYITELENLIEKAADYYIKKRKPNASSTEIYWWKRVMLAVAHQESFITHYRKGIDRKLRMMRGDYGHGHGLMQVDDRWHFAAVTDGRAANLIDNIFYAMDEFYGGWQKAATVSCVGSSTRYYTRARAAYGYYNGGPRSICRFTNPNHRWARNDRNFKAKLDGETWNRYISSSMKPHDVDVACLSNNVSSCRPSPTPPSPSQNKVFIYKGYYCALENGTYHCVSETEQKSCLIKKYNLENEMVHTSTPHPVDLLSREEACGKKSPIFSIGDLIELKKNINIRKTPGGLYLETSRAGEKYQILNTHVIESKDNARYYMIKRGRTYGYVYAGDDASSEDWAVPTSRVNELLLPVEDAIVSVNTKSGTNLRRSPGGSWLITVPSKTRLKVLSTVIKGASKELYIEVEYRGRRGYMYSGQVYPNNSVSYWLEIL